MIYRQYECKRRKFNDSQPARLSAKQTNEQKQQTKKSAKTGEVCILHMCEWVLLKLEWGCVPIFKLACFHSLNRQRRDRIGEISGPFPYSPTPSPTLSPYMW